MFYHYKFNPNLSTASFLLDERKRKVWFIVFVAIFLQLDFLFQRLFEACRDDSDEILLDVNDILKRQGVSDFGC